MTAKNPAAVALGRKGGRATSQAKADAARQNGRKGGRPRKAAAVCVCGHVRARHIDGASCMAYAASARQCPCETYQAR